MSTNSRANTDPDATLEQTCEELLRLITAIHQQAAVVARQVATTGPVDGLARLLELAGQGERLQTQLSSQENGGRPARCASALARSREILTAALDLLREAEGQARRRLLALLDRLEEAGQGQRGRRAYQNRSRRV